MSDKVAMNAELVTTESWFQSKTQGDTFTTWAPTDQHIAWFLCFCLKTPYSIHIVGSFTTNSQPTAA